MLRSATQAPQPQTANNAVGELNELAHAGVAAEVQAPQPQPQTANTAISQLNELAHRHKFETEFEFTQTGKDNQPDFNAKVTCKVPVNGGLTQAVSAEGTAASGTTRSPGPALTDEGEDVATSTLFILKRAPSSAAMSVLEIRQKFDKDKQPDVKKVINY